MEQRIPASLACALLLLGCGSGSDGARAAEPGQATGLADEGLVIIPEDPAHRGLTPEELDAQGVRPYFHDFGNVQVGEAVRHVFRLENTDPEPVEVSRMQASCSCTTAELRYTGADGEPVVVRSATRGRTQAAIPPGATAELALTLDTTHSEPTSHNTDKLYSLQMVTSSANRGFLRFEAHIFVERAVQATPQPLNLGRIASTGGGTGTIDIIAVNDSGVRLVGVGPLPPGVRAQIVAEPLYGSTLWVLEVTLEPPLAPGPHHQRFELMTEDADGLPYHPFPIEVQAFATEDVDHSPQRFLMRKAAEVDGPLTAEVELFSLLEGERLLVTDARLEGPGSEQLELRFAPNLRDASGRSEKWTLTVQTKVPFGEAIVRAQVVVELEGRDDVVIDVLAHPH